MDIEQFRQDFVQRLNDSGRSTNSVALDFELEQASLSRFARGKSGLSGGYLIKLWPFVYGRPLNPIPGVSHQTENAEGA